jgi:hypothetical protein
MTERLRSYVVQQSCIDEYDDSGSENETEETSSSQLSHVLVGNDDHESPAELSFLTTHNSSRSGRTLRVSLKRTDYCI